MATVGQLGASAMRRVTVHYANSPTRTTGDDSIDDGLLQFVLGQEGLHQSILDDGYSHQNHVRGAGPSDYSQSQYCQGEGSTGTAATSGVDEQIASDFEYAKQLQAEMEGLSVENDDISCVPSPSDTDDDDDPEHSEEEADTDRQDDAEDPENMTYEQGQALVESVGTEARGLSEELISFLDPWKYKGSGFFSRKTNHEDCPICLSTFKHGERLITLPCRHNYHKDCVTKWLTMEKTCPVCKYEVFGPC